MTNRKIKGELKDLDKIRPIDYSIVAKPHSPVYKLNIYDENPKSN